MREPETKSNRFVIGSVWYQEPIVDKLLALLDRLGLVYGAIDMRRTPSGEYYFFEVNTAGEFLFVEERTGLPIAKALADWLAAPRPVSRPSRAGRSAAARRRS